MGLIPGQGTKIPHAVAKKTHMDMHKSKLFFFEDLLHAKPFISSFSFSAQEAALCGGCTFAGGGIETQEDHAVYPEAQSSELSEVIPRWF